MKISTRFSIKSNIIKYTLVFFISVLSSSIYGQTNIGGIINTYEAVTGITNPGCVTCDTNPVCLNQINVGDASGFSVGDKVLIVQLKGATIDQTNTATGGSIISLGNAGNYEFFDISAIVGNTISPLAPLLNTYDSTGLVQIVRVPNYAGDVNVISELQAQPFNIVTGEGGIIALFVEGTLTLNANVNASGVGYIGVEMTSNGSPDNCGINPNVQYNLVTGNTDSWFKGGGVAFSGVSNQKGRAPLGNGGGAGVSGDSGGGGGANYGAGGIGGDRWCDVNGVTAGGIGGNALSPFIGVQNRVFFGGAGGAGFVTSGNSATASNGGGIVVIRATTLVGNNNIIDASGIDATATATGIDGGGGGGAGGSIAFDVKSYTGNLTIDIDGGDGQSLDTGVIHGPGGGGGGGVFLHNLSTLPGGITVSLSGGNSGVHNNAPNVGNAHNAQPGSNGGIIRYYDLVETENTDGNIGTNDGIPDLCDLDSDNDGILDSVEDGGTGIDPSLDADGDGIPNYSDQSDITAGFPPFVDTNGDGVNDVYDNDGDGAPDFQDLDSDNDGCFDSIESDGTDTNNDGALDGDGFNNVGQVTTGGAITDGYDGVTGNEIEAVQLTVDTTPTNQTENAGDAASFTALATADSATSYTTGTPNYGTPDNANVGVNYQWYIGDPDSGGTIIDGTDTNYTNFTTGTLNIADVTGLDATQYCVLITHDENSCIREINCATLTVNAVCDITAIASSNIDSCSDNGTPTILTDDTFTADITVTFTSAPATGTLNLTGDGTASVSAVGLMSPHTFVDVTLPADGEAIGLAATFSAETSCTFTELNVMTALFECSDDACPDVIPPGNPIFQLAAADVTFDITGTGGAAGAILNSITVAGEPNPFSGFYVPSAVEYQFSIPEQNNQYLYNMGVLGGNITDNAILFDGPLLEAYSDRDMTNYFSADNIVAPGITPTDFVDIKYDAPITSAANRYMVAMERGGNRSYRIQALDATGNPIGSLRTTNTSTYIDTNVQVDAVNFPGENIEFNIFPLTSFVTSGNDIYGFRIIYRNSSSGDGGDGKVFVLYDPAFLLPSPTIEATTSSVQPTCPVNQGSITIDATDNGGGTIEYSLNSLSGTNDQGWQASNVFSNLPPDTYTPSVRYQSTPTCITVSINPITLDDSGFNITAITSSDVTACNSNGTPSDITDDTFTADITVTFDGAPVTGTLDLTGDGTASVSAVGLTSPHTFNDVVFSANGNDVSLTATFSDAATCTYTDSAVLTAPTECSDDACNDAIPAGNPTAALVSGDVTFDITGTGGTAGAVINSIAVAGEPNLFTEFYVPSTVSYSFTNPAATNQYLLIQRY